MFMAKEKGSDRHDSKVGGIGKAKDLTAQENWG